MKNRLQKNRGFYNSFWLEKRRCFNKVPVPETAMPGAVNRSLYDDPKSAEIIDDHTKVMEIIDKHKITLDDKQINILQLRQKIQNAEEATKNELILKETQFWQGLDKRQTKKLEKALKDMQKVVDDTQKNLLKLAEKQIEAGLDKGNEKIKLDQEIIDGFKGVRGEQLDNSHFERLNGIKHVENALKKLGVLSPNTNKFLRNLLAGFWGVHKEVSYDDLIEAIVDLPENEFAKKMNEIYLKESTSLRKTEIGIYKNELIEDLKRLAEAISGLTFNEMAKAPKGNDRLAVAGEDGETLASHELALRQLCNFDDDKHIEAGIKKSTNVDDVDRGKRIRVNIMGDIGVDEIQLYDQIRTACVDENGQFSEEKFGALLHLASEKGKAYAEFMEEYSKKDGTADTLIKALKQEIGDKKLALKGQKDKQARKQIEKQIDELDKEIWLIREKEDYYEEELAKLKKYKTNFKFGKGDLDEEISVQNSTYKIKNVIFGLKAMYEGRNFNPKNKGKEDFSLASQRPLAENQEVRSALKFSKINPTDLHEKAQKGKEVLEAYINSLGLGEEEKAEVLQKIAIANYFVDKIKKEMPEGVSFSQEAQSQVLYHALLYGQVTDIQTSNQHGNEVGTEEELLFAFSVNKAIDLGRGFVLFLGVGGSRQENMDTGKVGYTPFVSGGVNWTIFNTEKFRLDFSAAGATSTFGATTLTAHYNFGDSKEWSLFLGGGYSTLGFMGFAGVERSPVRSMWNQIAERISTEGVNATFDGKTLNIELGENAPPPAELRQRIKLAIIDGSPKGIIPRTPITSLGVAAWLNGMILPFLSLSFATGTKYHAKGYSEQLLGKERQLMEQLALMDQITPDEKVVLRNKTITGQESYYTVPTSDGELEFAIDEEKEGSVSIENKESLTIKKLENLYKEPFNALGWETNINKNADNGRYYLQVMPKTNPAKDTKIMFAGKFADFANRAHSIMPQNGLFIDLGPLSNLDEAKANIPSVRVGNLSAHTGRSERTVIITDNTTDFNFAEVQKTVDKSAYCFYVRHQDTKLVRVNNYGVDNNGASLNAEGKATAVAPAGFHGASFDKHLLSESLEAEPADIKNYDYELTKDEIQKAEELATAIKEDNQKIALLNLIIDYGVDLGVDRSAIKGQILNLLTEEEKTSLGGKEYLFVRRVMNEVYERNSTDAGFDGNSLDMLRASGMVNDVAGLLPKQEQFRYSYTLTHKLVDEMKALLDTVKDFQRSAYQHGTNGEAPAIKAELAKIPGSLFDYDSLIHGSTAIMLARKGIGGGGVTLRQFTAFKDEVPTVTKRLADSRGALKLYVEQNEEDIKARIKRAIKKVLDQWADALGNDANFLKNPANIKEIVNEIFKKLKKNQKIDTYELIKIENKQTGEKKIVNLSFDLNAVVGFSYGTRGQEFECFNPVIAHGLSFGVDTDIKEMKTFLRKAKIIRTSVMPDPLKPYKDIWTISLAGGRREEDVEINIRKQAGGAGDASQEIRPGGDGSAGRVDGDINANPEENPSGPTVNIS